MRRSASPTPTAAWRRSTPSAVRPPCSARCTAQNASSRSKASARARSSVALHPDLARRGDRGSRPDRRLPLGQGAVADRAVAGEAPLLSHHGPELGRFVVPARAARRALGGHPARGGQGAGEVDDRVREPDAAVPDPLGPPQHRGDRRLAGAAVGDPAHDELFAPVLARLRQQIGDDHTVGRQPAHIARTGPPVISEGSRRSA